MISITKTTLARTRSETGLTNQTNMKILLDTEKATLQFNETTNTIELIWKSLHDSITYRHMFSQALHFIRETKATNWLSDIRHQGVVGPGDSNWLQQEIIPQAIQAGLKKSAAVINPDVFKKFYVQNISNNTNKKDGFEFRFFDSEEAANQWLSEKQAA